MKKAFQILTLVTLLISFSICQEKDSLIQLYPGIGDTLQKFDRDYFDLFRNIKGFEYATFYIRYHDRLVSKIKFVRENSIYDTTAIQSLAVLESLREQINRDLVRNDSVKYVQPEAIVLTKDQKEYQCRIEMFSKSNLYISEVEDLQSENDLNINLAIPVLKLDTIILIGKSDVLTSTLIGASVGAAMGGGLAIANSDDQLSRDVSLIFGAFLAVAGGIVGYIVGESEDDVAIKIESKNDLLKLKNYAKYYFKYDKSIEEKYVQVE